MKVHRFSHAGLSILLLAILVLGLIPLQTVLAVPLSWTDTNNMNAFRSNHTATPLMDGKVLVVGGLSGPLRTAELYNPSNGSWTFTGQMNSARANHTATLLADGRVLVVGGTNGTTPLSTAELYDPVSGTWAVTPPMSTSRYFHTATRLANGQVLVAGGVGVGSPSILTSAELYDPQTNSWTLTGPLNTRRNLHTATLLPNGQVLVAGGSSSAAITNTLKTSELYSPITGTWQTVANDMTTQRYLHTATMLSNGKVLVVGGGNFTDGYLKSAELYDSVAGTWTATTNSMSVNRFAHAATLLSFLDGHESVLVSGGSSGGGNILASTELYDPVSDTWTTTGSLNHARMSHTATQLFDTQVLATGGSQSGNLSSAELYDPTPPLSAPATPVTISPNGSTNTEVSYLWNTSDGATSYEIRVYTASPVNKILDKIVDTSFCIAGVCTYHPANPLPVGNYYFQVSAGNGYTPGSYSIFSPARTFNTVANFNLSGNTGTGEVTLTYFDVKLRKAVSDGNGNYSIPVSYDFSGAVIPSKTGYIFDPPSRNYISTPVQSDLIGQDYTATAIILTVIPAGNGLGTCDQQPRWNRLRRRLFRALCL